MIAYCDCDYSNPFIKIELAQFVTVPVCKKKNSDDERWVVKNVLKRFVVFLCGCFSGKNAFALYTVHTMNFTASKWIKYVYRCTECSSLTFGIQHFNAFFFSFEIRNIILANIDFFLFLLHLIPNIGEFDISYLYLIIAMPSFTAFQHRQVSFVFRIPLTTVWMFLNFS